MHNGRKSLHIFDEDPVPLQQYCTEILLEHVRLFLGAVGPDFLFMDNNARPHRTCEVSDTLAGENIHCVIWPSYYPDFNPILHAWGPLGRRIAQIQNSSRTIQKLNLSLGDI